MCVSVRCMRVRAWKRWRIRWRGSDGEERASWKEKVAGKGSGWRPCLHRMYERGGVRPLGFRPNRALLYRLKKKKNIKKQQNQRAAPARPSRITLCKTLERHGRFRVFAANRQQMQSLLMDSRS